MKRRDFLATAAASIAVAAGNVTPGSAETAGARRVGVLFAQADGDPEGQDRAAAFRAGLKEWGWAEGPGLALDIRWAEGDDARMNALAADLVRRRPDVILAGATRTLVALQKATRTVPIVFAQVTDPVGAGFVASLAKPGGNSTGLTQHEFAIGEKWLDLLKQVAPWMTRVCILIDARNPATEGYLAVIAPAARGMGLDLVRAPFRDRAGIEAAIREFAGAPNGGLVLLPGSAGSVNRDLVIALAERHRLPAIYAFRYHAVSGGLISYGVDNIDLFRRAAWYVDRILKGAKPGDLPVQHANKFQLVVNMKTAKAMGIGVPLSLLASADEVIE